MTELLSLPDLPVDQMGSAQMLVAAAGTGGAVAYKVALASYLTAAGAAGTYAQLMSPSFLGVPTAPTAATGVNSTQIATTAFVARAVAGITTGAPTGSPSASLAVLTSDDVTRALGYSPYNAANPTGYQTAADITTALGSYLTFASAVSAYQPLLGFTPYNSTNPSNYQTAAQVATTLAGYSTINYVDSRFTALLNSAPAAFDTLGEIGAALASDESAAAALTTLVAGKLAITTAASTYLTVTSAASTYQTALGFTPYNATNPAGYIAAAGAPVQSVAGRQGNIVLAVGDITGAYASTNPAGYQTAAQVSSALTGYAAVSYVDARFTALLNSAPAAFDTLGEIGAALASDESAAAALTTLVSTKLAIGVAASTYAPLASPTFTGAPVIPGYLTTAIAASTYALASSVPVASAVAPVANGTAAVGTSNAFARADHVHPSAAIGAATITAGASYAMAAADRRVYVRKTTGSATAVTLPSSPVLHELYIVKDAKGDAATNAITIGGGTIDGASSYVLNNNYESAAFVNNGVDWSIVA